MSTPAIRATGLHKTFKATDGTTVTAVENVDLTIQRGEIVAFLGPNGAGKTTTVDMLLGLTTPTSGEVEIMGMTPRQAVESGRVSAVMQTGGLLQDFTVGETVEAIAALHGRLDRVEAVIERTGLVAVRARKVQACSGGEQQRLRFALALIPDPDVILLDEPTTGMDVAARQQFWDTMRADAATGRTILFATHYLAEADANALRTVLMARGRIVEDGPTADVRAAFGGRTVSFRPPAFAVRPDGIDEDWLARVRTALAPLGVEGIEVASASLEAAFLALTTEPSDGEALPTLETTGALR
ncbi:MAG: ABC transporter ATP-binding protein [Nocardioides sp.]|uniref:ABC transporter ATP-binding protein n=1 Tax=Nocardioides sp. TaxID=35761 RepID=UPI003266F325